MRLRIRLEFKLNDLWVGAYWQWHEAPADMTSCFPVLSRPRRVLDVWVCLLPCLPLHFTLDLRRPVTTYQKFAELQIKTIATDLHFPAKRLQEPKR